MRRTLHLKLVLILMLLIVSLMVVVGAFLMNSVTGYYIQDFYSQTAAAFGQDNADFVRDLQTAQEGETDGAAMVEAVLSTNRPDRENLLILGESYDNAVIQLLASHFNNTYAVDLRYYQPYLGKDFRFSDYVEERGITKVLLIGCMTYFCTPEGALEG